ncbi:PRC-barrel protein [Neoasaia chiangmaiensis NBRC 101099]|nr:PRC-barrel domain-containing protein [Neoasaia chiangmaiensis]GBR38213.1 PRC-barrel protein [Neoasaia chiangmaiensis NBRC 101099]GEN15988.1 photosystem reaction center subunit H [Neoasaia chiangmaiensis]
MSQTMQDLSNETHDLIASDRVEGTAVYSRSGEHLGTVKNFMVDKQSGHVAYAVMSFGGFLGIGDRYHPLPWKTLHYDPGRSGYVVDLTADQLRDAPNYGSDTAPNWDDQIYGHSVDDYYAHAGTIMR